MSMYKWWDFVNDVGEKKTNILRQDSLAYKDYSPFMVNRGLSNFVDCVMYANEMNKIPLTDKQMQYDYYIGALRGKKRWGEKSEKPEKFKNLDLVKRHYNYSDSKAKEALELLTDDDIKRLKQLYEIGGRK